MRKWTFVAATLVCVAFLAAAGCQKNGASAENRAKENIPSSGADHNPDLSTANLSSVKPDEDVLMTDDDTKVDSASRSTRPSTHPVTPSSAATDIISNLKEDLDLEQSLNDSIEEQETTDSQPTGDLTDFAHNHTDDVVHGMTQSLSPTPFNRDDLRLIGFTIGDSLDRVIDFYGDAAVMYRIEDTAGSLLIYEYDGFTIGFNAQQVIEFIDIASSAVESGIVGVQIGHSKSTVLDTLGTPSMETDFVLNYQSEKLNLKLEIDPEYDRVNSIKLFPQL